MTAITTTNRLLTIARNIGDVVAAGTATGGSATTIIDTANLIHATSDQLKGYYVYVHTGTNSGKERVITAFDQTTYKITFATMTTVCDTTTQYVIFRKHHYEDYNKALTLAEDAAAEAIAQDRHDYFIPLIDETLSVNDLLMGAGQMERWTNGIALAPDSWTKDTNSTVAQESSIRDRGLYSAKLVSNGVNLGLLSWSLGNYRQFAGQNLTIKAKILTATASRVTSALYDGTTLTTSSYHSGGGGWEEVDTAEVKVADEGTVTTLALYLGITAGAAVTAYFDDVRLLSLENLYQYTLPTVPYEFYTISEIWQESDTEGYYDYLLPKSAWSIHRGYNANYLVFYNFPLTSDRHLRIIGQTKATVTREAKDNYIVASATYMMCMMEVNSPEMVQKAQIWRAEVDRLWKVMEYERQALLQKWGTHTRTLSGSVVVKYR